MRLFDGVRGVVCSWGRSSGALLVTSVFLSGCSGERPSVEADNSEPSSSDESKDDDGDDPSTSDESEDDGDESSTMSDESEDDETSTSDDPTSSEDDDEDSESDDSTSDSDEDDDGSSDSSDEECPDPPAGPECDADDIEGQLDCIPEIIVKSAESAEGGGMRFNLEIEQPVDHSDESAGSFRQRLTLLHVAPDAPLVFKTSGYGLTSTSHEIASFFRANVIALEHRYFNSSTPDAPVDWTYLDIEQSANDFHRVYRALKWLYPEPWVNTGASKGGETVVFHRRFFPCDVEATVAYVAPIVYGDADERFVDFMADVGGPELSDCRQKLRDIQREILSRRDAMLSRLDGLDFSLLGGASVALEHSVIELPFVFFQYHVPAECSKIPSTDATDDVLFDYLESVGRVSGMADGSLAGYQAYFYQAATELGAPAGDMEHLSDLLEHKETYEVASYVPDDIPVSFDPDVMPEIQDWVSHHGERIMFIYGENDPWTAAAYELGDAEDSFMYSVAQGNHGATINRLPTATRDEAVGHLERWLSSRRVRTQLTAAQENDDRADFRRPLGN